jgi:hypothetical protein
VSISKLEAFLARIYVDEKSRTEFLNDPEVEARRAGLSTEECEAVEQIDRVGLVLMAASLERKRQKTHKNHG